MDWIQRKDSSAYLEASEFIDFQNPKVQIIAQYCMERALHEAQVNPKGVLMDPEAETARQCYLLVRDEIKHSHDIDSDKVTFKASSVLSEKEGLCFAKANLLAALLRACGIPAGIGYQYLRLDTPESPLILHALNFIWLEAANGWFRVDARGNRDDIKAEFSYGEEKLAFKVDPGIGECDLPFIFASHDKAVVAKFKIHETLDELWNDLPDKLSGNE